MNDSLRWVVWRVGSFNPANRLGGGVSMWPIIKRDISIGNHKISTISFFTPHGMSLGYFWTGVLYS